MNILGTERTVRAFRRSDFRKFIREHMDTRRIVFSSVGNVPMEKVIRLAERYLGSVPAMRSQRKRKWFSGYQPRERELMRPVKQARCAIGQTAYPMRDERRSALYMLTSILGGSSMNSRLNMALREKRGYVYSVGAQYIPFTDVGLFVISFGTEPGQLKKSVELVHDELRKMRDERMGVKQLAAAKEQLLGHIAMAEENNMSFMMMMGRNLLDLGRVTTLDEIFQRVRDTSAAKLQELANDVFAEEKLSYLRMLPGKE
jgi:predicted Zn-dependent peptidase